MTEGIDLRNLAQMMLDWETAQRRADEIAEAIKDTVLQLGQTQTVGNIRASYSQGRKTYDYEEAAREHPMVSEATIKLFTKVKKTVNWNGICQHIGIEKPDIPFSQSEPSVTLKILS